MPQLLERMTRCIFIKTIPRFRCYMDTVLQTPSWFAILWMKSCLFWFEIYWNLFTIVQLMCIWCLPSIFNSIECDIVQDIYSNTLLLVGSAGSYKLGTFLDLYNHIVNNKFVTIISNKVDDFNFEVVICYLCPQSNINSILGYTKFHSYLIHFLRLCYNINDFLFRAKT